MYIYSTEAEREREWGVLSDRPLRKSVKRGRCISAAAADRPFPSTFIDVRLCVSLGCFSLYYNTDAILFQIRQRHRLRPGIRVCFDCVLRALREGHTRALYRRWPSLCCASTQPRARFFFSLLIYTRIRLNRNARAGVGRFICVVINDFIATSVA